MKKPTVSRQNNPVRQACANDIPIFGLAISSLNSPGDTFFLSASSACSPGLGLLLISRTISGKIRVSSITARMRYPSRQPMNATAIAATGTSAVSPTAEPEPAMDIARARRRVNQAPTIFATVPGEAKVNPIPMMMNKT